PRFFSERLSAEMATAPSFTAKSISPAILLSGSVEKRLQGKVLTRAGRVNVIGIEPNSLVPGTGSEATVADGNRVALSERLARDLEVRAGEEVTLLVELPSDIPRDALLGKRDESAVEITLTVGTVLPEDSFGSRFGLKPDQQLPANAFVSLAMLQERL